MWNNKCIVDSFLTTPLIYVTSCQIYLYMTHSHIHIRHVWIHLKFCPRMNQKKSFCQNVAIHSSRLFFSLWRIFSKTSSQKKSTNFYSRKSIFATNCCPLSCSKDANKRKALSRRWQISKRHDQPYWYIGFRPRITIFEVKHAAKGI